MKKSLLLKKIIAGSHQNVRFNDFVSLIEDFGFALERIKGSHHIYSHPAIQEFINLQEVSGQVKPYQIKQFLVLVERYKLKMEN